MKKRIIALLLALVMSVMLLPGSAFADNDTAAQTDMIPAADICDGGMQNVVRVNPLYEGIVTEQEIAELTSCKKQTASVTAVGEAEYLTFSTAVQYVRTCMENRVGEIELYFYADTSAVERDLKNCPGGYPGEYLLEAALAETGVATQGDYIRWVYGGYSSSYYPTKYNGHTAYYLYYDMSYYTTAEQEKQVTNKLQSVFSSFGFTGSTDDYTKVSRIYRYLCDNVVYDYDHLSNPGYKLQFTAYAALINGTSVCQGYAVLMYRMLWMAGVPARVVTGGNHAWNSIKVGGLYYFGDTTWDAGRSSSYYGYFLKGLYDFYDHSFDPEFDDDFFTEYQHANYKYVYNPGHTHVWDSGTVAQKPTCTQAGIKVYNCACGASIAVLIPPLGHDYDSSGYCKRCHNERGVKIDSNSFPDSTFRSIVLENYDKDGNQYLSNDEIADVWIMDLGNFGLSSIKGIEYFNDLMFLDCSGNDLTQIDVSQNTALVELSCDYNRLTALDVSKNTALQYLYCDSNALTKLDLSKNTKLLWLWCSYNELTALNVSKNTALEYLYCNGNSLTMLDLSKNTALTNLNCNNNAIATLDLSKNTKLVRDSCSISPQTVKICTPFNGFNLGSYIGSENISRIKSVESATLNNGIISCSSGQFTYYYDTKSTMDSMKVVFKKGTCKQAKFTDAVPNTHWAHNAIDYVVSRRIMSGTGTTTFEPNGTLTRAMVVNMLYNLAGEPAHSTQNRFTDVPAGAWYADAVLWASDSKIVSGKGDGIFDPNGAVTRQELANMMQNYAKYIGRNVSASYSLSKFADANDVASWATDAVKWACANGIINGSSDGGKLYLNPKGNATRAQIAVIFENFFKKFNI